MAERTIEEGESQEQIEADMELGEQELEQVAGGLEAPNIKGAAAKPKAPKAAGCFEAFPKH